jgi:hypothetical protein
MMAVPQYVFSIQEVPNWMVNVLDSKLMIARPRRVFSVILPHSTAVCDLLS